MAELKKKKTEKGMAWLAYPKHRVEVEVVDQASSKSRKVVLVAAVAKKEKEKKQKQEPILKEFPDFRAQLKEWLSTGERDYLGMGEVDKLDQENLGGLFAFLAKKKADREESIVVELPAVLCTHLLQKEIIALATMAFGTAVYPTDLLKTKPTNEKIRIKKIQLALNTAPEKNAQAIANEHSILAAHVNAMRQTQALPGNYLTALAMEQRARDIAKQYPVKLTVLGRSALEKVGAGGILAVNQGSEKEPRMLILDYNPKGATKTLALVGKGVTFDAGGISLKPPTDMHEMKFDMSGSAAVVHAVAAIAELKIPVRVVGAVGMVENMPGTGAIKPGDVYISMKGLTIEVQNTDAEGRLVLADVLHYTEKNYKPDLMIDLATLTGACVVALGFYYAGLFAPKKKVRELIEQASDESLEPVWPLPVGRLYRDMLKSNIADHNNIGGRWGGSSSAAAFLSLFVDEKTNWAHLDIAGVGMLKKEYGVYSTPASGYGVRLLAQIARNLAKAK